MKQTRAKNQAKINIPMCLACVLFCLALFTLHITSGLYARYKVLDQGTDTSDAASFQITESCTSFSEEIEVSLEPGTFSKTILVTNKSEVAVSYKVTVKNETLNLPLMLSINGTSSFLEQRTETIYIDPDEQHEIVLQITWNEEGALDYMGMVDYISVSAVAEQIN